MINLEKEFNNKKLLMAFKYEFQRVFGISEDDFWEDTLCLVKDRPEFINVLKYVCKEQNKEDLYDYLDNIQSNKLINELNELFLDLSKAFLNHNLMMFDKINTVAKTLNIPKNKLAVCMNCKKIYKIENMLEISNPELLKNEKEYICLYCDDKLDKKKYFQEKLKQMEKSKKNKDKNKDK